MSIKHNHSKIKGMKKQEGMASIVVVSVLVVIMTLISVGFARIISRTVNNAANRQNSSAASYAAQSAINDVASFIKNDPARASGSATNSSTCTGPGSLIGTQASPGPFYYDANISGNNAAHYTCLLLNQTPPSLYYTQLATEKSRVVKASTSAASGALEKYMISWQPTNKDVLADPGYPDNTLKLYDKQKWNDPSSGVCHDDAGAVAACTPMLRVTFYPIPASGNTGNVQAKSKTFFLYPQKNTVGNIREYDYTTDFPDGSLLPVDCSKTVDTTRFVGAGSSVAETCSVVFRGFSNIYAAADPLKYAYMRFTPVYGSADVRIRANDKFGQSLSFTETQALVDATATAGGVSKRLQATVDISPIFSPGNIDDNLGTSIEGIPENTLRSAAAICKRVNEFDTPFHYVDFDEPNSVCHQNDLLNIPNPTTTLQIQGNELDASGGVNFRTRDSADLTPDAAHQGTLYTTAAGNGSVLWNAKDTSTCTSNWGPITLTGQNTSGSYNFNGLTNVTNFTFHCMRGALDAGTKQVTAWPPPRVGVSSSVSAPEAGQPYTINWSSANTVRCVLSGDWPDNSPTALAGSEDITWTQAETQNPNLVKIFKTQCFDPIGRSDKKAIVFGPAPCPAGFTCLTGDGTGTTGGGCGYGGPCYGPPSCSANVWFSGSTVSDAVMYWDTNCDYYDAANWWQGDRYVHTTKDGAVTWDGYASPGWMGKTLAVLD
jgi:Tfp pilus assembly protein PilX